MRTIHRLTTLFILFLISSSSLFAQTILTSNLGREFYLTFPKQYYEGAHVFQLFISSQEAASGVVAVPGSGFLTVFSVPAGGMTVVSLPESAGVTVADGVTPQGAIHVVADGEVAVYGFAYQQYATEAFLGLPVPALGQNYMVTSFPTQIFSGIATMGGEFAVVATSDATTLPIRPSVTTGARVAGVPYTVSLNRWDVYSLIDVVPDNDLTGTTIDSNRPVAVFSGSQIADVPSSAYLNGNYLVEQAWPLADWGTRFVTVPLATRSNGDLFRVLACCDGTNVYLDGALVATLSAGRFYQQEIVAASEIRASNPVNVTQYANGRTWDGAAAGDPSMVTVPPVNAFAATYVVGAPLDHFDAHYINLSAPSSIAGSILLDGVLVPAALFSPVGSSGYSAAQVTVGVGSHNLSGPAPFGVISYGFAFKDGYSYPGALQLIENPPTWTPTPTFTPTPTLSPTPPLSSTPTMTPIPPFRVWPNPYDPSTAAKGALKAGYLPGGVVTVYTVSGEKVARLTPLEGWYEWDGRTEGGRRAAPGVYYYVAKKDEEEVAKGVLLIR